VDSANLCPSRVRISAMNAHRVISLDPRDDPRWHALSLGERGSLFTSPPWIEAVCGAYGFQPEARVSIDSAGRPVGGFAWVPIEDLLGERLSSLPFSDRAEPLVDGESEWKELSAEAFATGLPFTMRCFDNSIAVTDPRLDTVGAAAWHGTPLTGTLD